MSKLMFPTDEMKREERQLVHDVVDGELDYQDRRWNASTTTTAGKHTVGEFLVFMDDYLREAKTQLSRNGEPQATQMALHGVRKITALGFSCMLQNGAPERKA